MLAYIPALLLAVAPVAMAADPPICGYFFPTSQVTTMAANSSRVSRGLDCPQNPGTVTISNTTAATNAFSLTCQNSCAVAVEGSVYFTGSNNRSISADSLYPIVNNAVGGNWTQSVRYALPATGECIPAGQSGYYQVTGQLKCVTGYFNKCVTTILQDNQGITICAVVWADQAASQPAYNLSYVTTGPSANVTASVNPATATGTAAAQTGAAWAGRSAGYAGFAGAGLAAAMMLV